MHPSPIGNVPDTYDHKYISKMRTVITLIFTSLFLMLVLSQNDDLALRLEEGKGCQQISMLMTFDMHSKHR